MQKNRLVSALAFVSLVTSMGLFAFGMHLFDSPYVCTSSFIASLAALVVAFLLIGSLRCNYCGKKLEIKPFPSHNPLPKFFFWTGAEAPCSHCHENA